MTDETHLGNERWRPRENRPDETPVEPGRYETPEAVRPLERRLKAIRLRPPGLDPSELGRLSAVDVETAAQDVRPRVERVGKRAASWKALGAAWSFGVVVGAVAMLALANLRSAATPSTIRPRDEAKAAGKSPRGVAANEGTGSPARESGADQPGRSRTAVPDPAEASPVQDAFGPPPDHFVLGGRRPISRVALHVSSWDPCDLRYPLFDEAISGEPSSEQSDSPGAWPRRDVYRRIDCCRVAEELFGTSCEYDL